MDQTGFRRAAALFGSALVCAAPAGASAQGMTATTDCERAAEAYKSALGKIDTALRAYADCVSASRGKDACSPEFRRLRTAQTDFEEAVDAIRARCTR
ncbi:MAG TPA: hypothetical protein VF699_06800 [Caulobacteraceae bacterium]|jgi:streptogramin lyase